MPPYRAAQGAISSARGEISKEEVEDMHNVLQERVDARCRKAHVSYGGDHQEALLRSIAETHGLTVGHGPSDQAGVSLTGWVVGIDPAPMRLARAQDNAVLAGK
jgi:hypothetical protein